ncbi:hypothetical protein P355_1610 [Burkholderia cenocepacia KC-01]|nr:hypothetical protein P355_1610 [Burkholderia cenocepacia KC-01]
MAHARRGGSPASSGLPVRLALCVPRLPFGQFDAIARERLVVKIEDARRATAVAAVFQFGLDRRGRAGIVDGRISGSLVRHGVVR